jgi:hypothetical protein
MATAPYAPGQTTFAPGTNLNPISYIRDEKILRVRDQAVLPQISVFKDFGHCGQALNIRHEYTGSDRAQHMTQGGVVKPVTVRAPKEETFIVGDKFGALLRFPECDWMKIQENDPSMINEVATFYQEDTLLSFDTRAFALIIGEAEKHNRGMNAGYRTHAVDLGTQQSPLETNEETVWAQHRSMIRVMRERGLTATTGRPMYALIHEGFMDYISLNDRLSAYYMNGACHSCDSAVMGDQRTIDGINYIHTKCLPVVNDGNDLIYPILFGYPEALWAAFDTVIRREQGPMGDDNEYIGMYWHLGLKLIDPRRVGVMWVRIPSLDTGGQ